jgi:maltose phosphorylase
MNRFVPVDEWMVIEEGFDPGRHSAAESVFSIGNGHMGQRANFEERYSGVSLPGSYVAGIYYPDKTRVGWWKNGYPEYFAKVLNAPNWIGIDVTADGMPLDLAHCRVENFRRVLDMRSGTLSRSFVATLANGVRLKVEALRFVSMAEPEIGVVRYAVTALADLKLTLAPYLDGDVRNRDANYDEQFWNVLETAAGRGDGLLLAQTKKLDFRVGLAAQFSCETDRGAAEASWNRTPVRTGNGFEAALNAGETATVVKIVAVTTSLDYPAGDVAAKAREKAAAAHDLGLEALFAAHRAKWMEIWNRSDVEIEGDVEAQQGIRFAIFQLNQTCTGEDARLNVGPKGFTGEKYGGSTYWDTEAFCFPFYLATAPSKVARNLLLYRYRHLPKAIENAARLGYSGGAALYPMVTMNGEECHNEWEITFEEVHRNGAIAFAIYNYIRHTGDARYLADCGLEVLIGIARFWAQRASFSCDKHRYVILGVTGPNEYENNVNNNWYTNTIACWCMDYAAAAAGKVKAAWPERYAEIVAGTGFDETAEIARWATVRDGMYFPYDKERRLFLQQDGYLDKEQTLTRDIDPAERPINQHWSWDRILRSPFIKQADLLQGVYLFEERFDTDFIRRHFEFYEARTVHESSLSPCIHAILAARIGEAARAYELFQRAARLDLDDYNREVEEGLHITSMGGAWMAAVEGFGGKRMRDGKLFLSPLLPEKWQRYCFRLFLGDRLLKVGVTADVVEIFYDGPSPVVVNLYGEDVAVRPGEMLRIPRDGSAGRNGIALAGSSRGRR